MRCTLWSRGRLLGETDLGFVYRENGFRCGWLDPTELGDQLMEAASGVPPALRAQWIIGPEATTRADVLSAIDQAEALELQLRGPDGAVIATESIAIIDTRYLLSLAESDLDHEDAVDADEAPEIDSLPEAWNVDRDLVNLQLPSDEGPDFPRYQIQVHLVDHDSLP